MKIFKLVTKAKFFFKFKVVYQIYKILNNYFLFAYNFNLILIRF